MMIRSINSEILDNDTAISLKNFFFITGKIKLIKLSSHFLWYHSGEDTISNYLGEVYLFKSISSIPGGTTPNFSKSP